MKALEKKIRSYMENNFEKFRDSGGEINRTRLAEDCACFMDGASDRWLDDDTHIVWEVAVEFCDK